MRPKNTARWVTAAISGLLLVLPTSVAAPASLGSEDQIRTANESSPTHHPQIDEFLPNLPHSPEERQTALENAGFQLVDSRTSGPWLIDTFRKSNDSGVALEYDIARTDTSTDAEGPTITPYWNIGWDWGTRLYMRGEEFWSLGATGFSSAICQVVAGLPGAVACGVAAQAAWQKLTGNSQILNDPTCYDLSQALNVGWEEVPEEKCQ